MTLSIAKAIQQTPAWRHGFEARQAGHPIEGNPYTVARGSRGLHLVAIWQAGWLAADRNSKAGGGS